MTETSAFCHLSCETSTTTAASAFTPESLLREARRQKDVPNTPVPEICILDPDGDIVRHLRAEAARGRSQAGPVITARWTALITAAGNTGSSAARSERRTPCMEVPSNEKSIDLRQLRHVDVAASTQSSSSASKSGQPVGRYEKPSPDSFQRIVFARHRDGP